MQDQAKTKQDLIREMAALRERVEELQRTDAALHDTERRHRLLFEHSPDGILIIDPATARPLEFNETAYRQLGYSREEFAKLTIFDLEVDETPGETRARIARVLREGRADFETRQRTRRGEIKNVHVTAQIVEILGKSLYHCIWRDITDRKRAVEALVQSEEKFRKAFYTSPDSIAINRLGDGRYVSINPGFTKIMGYTEEEIIGKSSLELNIWDNAEDRQRLVAGLKRDGIVTNLEAAFRAKDGEIRYGLMSASLIDLNGVPHILNITRDISDRRRAEEQWRRNRETAERLAEEMAVIPEIGRVFSSTLDIDEVFDRFAAEAKKLIAFDRIVVNLNEPQKDIIYTTFSCGLDVPGRRPGEIYPFAGSMNELLMQTRTGLINRLSTLEETAERYPGLVPAFRAGMRSMMAVPLISRDVVVGGLHFHSQLPDAHTEQDLRLAERIGDQIAGAIASAELYKDLRETERSLRESEGKYRLIAENTADLISIQDMNLRFTYISPAIKRLRGFTVDEAMEQTLDQVLTPESLRISLNVFQEEMQKEASGTADPDRIRILELEEYKKDGSTIWMEVSLCFMRDPERKPIAILVVSRDITERKRADRALQRQNFYLESLNETALSLMRRTNLTDIFQAIIERAVLFSGADEGWIFIYDDQNGAFDCKAVTGRREYRIGERIDSGSGISEEVWRTGQTVLVDDYHVWEKRAKGREYDVRRATVAIPMQYEGRLAGILGLAHHDAAKRFLGDELAILERSAELASIALDNARLYDRMKRELVERKQAEEENLRLAERLQQAEKMEALGTLAGGVAHDLNNVLGIVVGYAELLLNEVGQSSPIRSRLLNIMSGGEKAAAIVQDLLTLARRGVTSRQILNLNQTVVSDQRSPEFEKLASLYPAVRVKIDLEPNILNISGSKVHIGKTLFNLVANAYEAMPKGGLLTIRTANQYIDRPIQGYDEVREGDYVVLSVSDTGEGIAAADRKRIFEPFYTKKVMGRSGTGLGLSVVWGTVKDHHGYINVQSEQGKGSTFTLYFPVSREEITAERMAADISQYMGRGESILVVDDVPGQRDLAAAMLGKLNYRVASVSSGEEAVAWISDHPVDLMVLDMILGSGMDGLDTYRSVLEIYPKQKAIIVSGFSETERVSRAQELGAGAYVRKPYVIEKLGMAVRSELDRAT
ncbi:MAG: PAS domain S-box protein [Deltaproteobacteria bacterium]|nr:PAS domain S-box protein [Deltaproteobacteria bacterium]